MGDLLKLIWPAVAGPFPAHPNAEWLARQLTEACGWDEPPRYLIRDRDGDGADGAAFIRRIRTMGIRDRPVSARSPWQWHKIIEMTSRHNIPAIYRTGGFVRAGGLISYNADFLALSRQIGSLCVAQILKGARPADLPVQQPTKFELVINVKTAEALSLPVPPNLLALADEVIE